MRDMSRKHPRSGIFNFLPDKPSPREFCKLMFQGNTICFTCLSFSYEFKSRSMHVALVLIGYIMKFSQELTIISIKFTRPCRRPPNTHDSQLQACVDYLTQLGRFTIVLQIMCKSTTFSKTKFTMGVFGELCN